MEMKQEGDKREMEVIRKCKRKREKRGKEGETNKRDVKNDKERERERAVNRVQGQSR